jgi:predicted nuclease of restriction endonuclease-like (RecB) superfamily
MTNKHNQDSTELHRSSGNGQLFDRVVTILDQARAHVIRSINGEMIIAYWLIGREIVEALQGGDDRAMYGQRLIQDLSFRLTQVYGQGFSITNLRYFRTFYLTYADRRPEIRHTACGELSSIAKSGEDSGVMQDLSRAIEKSVTLQGFSARLSWSHYREIMKVEHVNARMFYEIEAEKEGWSVRHLQRQIYTHLFARLLKSHDKEGSMALASQGQTLQTPLDALKDPYVLDFLGLPDAQILHESDIEAAIISNMQSFLLEMGKGFAFVSRQKRIQFDDASFFIDLVFYHCILKCYVLIDLKIGELTHQDIGQIDGYVRMFDEQYTVEGDNPTIGLILCSEKNAAIVKYSVLNESRQLFAAKYLAYLPSEQELRRELMRERELVETQMDDSGE